MQDSVFMIGQTLLGPWSDISTQLRYKAFVDFYVEYDND